MPGLVPGIYADQRAQLRKALLRWRRMDGRDKPGHDAL